ncbi:MAG: DnaT-like ssDNA-binding domain-containing protein [Spongiibacteraceae bacterium]|jgi:hypothetical protein|nr:DnaT-like ssDNA-binding domain-containing protein [Spongiibacteraceae bacterium]
MSSLLPERPLWFSPTLAATLGLEQAILYQLLADCHGLLAAEDGWCTLHRERLGQWLPFWSTQQLQDTLTALVDQGLVQLGSARHSQGPSVRYALNATPQAGSRAAPPAAAPAAHRRSSRPTGAVGPSALGADWRPDEETLKYLANFHGVPADFIEVLLPEFITYWRDNGATKASWNSTFLQHAVRKWKEYKYQRVEEQRTVQIDNDWQPAPEVFEILERDGINRNFIEDAIPEFILLWRERGSFQRNWSSLFVQHIRKQWARYRQALTNEQELGCLPASWQPSAAVFDILAMASIDPAFARRLIPEFVLFWHDSGEAHRSWNSKFLQHVKYQWATQHQLTGHHHAGQRYADQPGAQGAQTIFDRLTDRSWAAGLVEDL